MMYFICYDIANPKRLAKVAKKLENFGLRVQYSFFQCEMEKPKLDELRQQLLSVIDKKEDNLRIFPLCEDCVKKTESIGTGSIFVSENYQIL